MPWKYNKADVSNLLNLFNLILSLSKVQINLNKNARTKYFYMVRRKK